MFDISQEKIFSFLITYPIFLLALSFHELAHAITAKWGGDQTAAYQGRITMNPLSHIDPIGTVLMPILMGITTGLPFFGWARPVPVVETNYRRGDGYGVVVALAGPFSNLILVVVAIALLQIFSLTLAGMYFHVAVVSPDSDGLVSSILSGDAPIIGLKMLQYFLHINIILMFFNLLPIPPLDGSHVLWHWIIKPRRNLWNFFFTYQRFGIIVLIVFIAAGGVQFYFETIVSPFFNLCYYLVNIPGRMLYHYY